MVDPDFNIIHFFPCRCRLRLPRLSQHTYRQFARKMPRGSARQTHAYCHSTLTRAVCVGRYKKEKKGKGKYRTVNSTQEQWTGHIGLLLTRPPLSSASWRRFILPVVRVFFLSFFFFFSFIVLFFFFVWLVYRNSPTRCEYLSNLAVKWFMYCRLLVTSQLQYGSCSKGIVFLISQSQ